MPEPGALWEPVGGPNNPGTVAMAHLFLATSGQPPARGIGDQVFAERAEVGVLASVLAIPSRQDWSRFGSGRSAKRENGSIRRQKAHPVIIAALRYACYIQVLASSIL